MFYNTIQKERSFGIISVLNRYGITVFDFSSHTVNYQRVKEVTWDMFRWVKKKQRIGVLCFSYGITTVLNHYYYMLEIWKYQ